MDPTINSFWQNHWNDYFHQLKNMMMATWVRIRLPWRDKALMFNCLSNHRNRGTQPIKMSWPIICKCVNSRCIWTVIFELKLLNFLFKSSVKRSTVNFSKFTIPFMQQQNSSFKSFRIWLVKLTQIRFSLATSLAGFNLLFNPSSWV